MLLVLCLDQSLSEPQSDSANQDSADACDPRELGPNDIEVRATKQNSRGERHEMSRRRELHDLL
jgi:hypothetical protein